MAAGETVLYYHPDVEVKPSKLAGVLFRMKIRIRRVQPEEVGETIGYLAGLKGFEKGAERVVEAAKSVVDAGSEAAGDVQIGAEGKTAGGGQSPGRIDDEVLVLSNLSSSRLNELLAQMKKAGIPKIALKAMVTPTNCKWSFYDLYKEIKEEHETLNAQRQ